MEGVVAIEVTTDEGAVCYFVTWGRVQDPVDPRGVEHTVLRFAHTCATPGVPVSARLCGSLSEARDAPFFYEAIIRFAQTPIPYGRDSYPRWRQETKTEMENGKHIYFVGPGPPPMDNAPPG